MSMFITASMLYDFVQCPHRVTMDLFADPVERDPVSPFVELLWERGHAFEREVVEGLTIPFINLRPSSDDERERLTLKAMAEGQELIYGGRLRAQDLLGEPDLLRRTGGGYAAGDIKSGAGLEGMSEDKDGKPKKHYAVQLALYTDLLERLNLSGGRSPFVWDVHGEEIVYSLDRPQGPRTPTSLWDEYQACLAKTRSIAAREAMSLPAYGGECKLCHWRTACLKRLEQLDDLTLIPELGRARRESLVSYVSTVEELARVDLSSFIKGGKSKIPSVGAPVLQRFHARARLQKRSNARPYFFEPLTLPPTDLELFFDVETDPMRDVCYLHGFLERRVGDPATERYIAFFAEEPSPEAEEQAFTQAWQYIQTTTPSAVYYYTPYERTTWRRLSSRYPGVATEADVRALFESRAFLDLYHDAVHSKMEWPTRDLSIKTLAKYLGFRWRDIDPSGAASIEWYHRWVDSRDIQIKQRILEYNEDDCLATRVLVDAIRKLNEDL
jgi:predicted RecB family nuclease